MSFGSERAKLLDQEDPLDTRNDKSFDGEKRRRRGAPTEIAGYHARCKSVTTDQPLRLAGEFSPSTRDEWRAAVDRVLSKGKRDLNAEELNARFNQELVTELLDHVSVEPLYTKDDVVTVPATGMPGLTPFVRGASLLGGSQVGWDVRQAVDCRLTDLSDSNSKALRELELGATSLFLRASAAPAEKVVTFDADTLGQMLDGVFLDLVTISLDQSLGSAAPDGLLRLFERRDLESSRVRAVLGIDPIGAFASSPDHVDLEQDRRTAVAMATRCASDYADVRAIVVDVVRYHDAGCSDTEELAIAMATGIEYLRLLTEAGVPIETASSQIEFRIAATADQFLTIAKLRAARRLWSRITSVSGASTAIAQRQHVVTSRAMMTRYDPWVNLLRGTIACFAAGAGGADAITVEPYDLLIDATVVSDLGRRLARNTHIVLMEESHSAKVVDPAGGSWYVESLTESLARESWRFMQAIESDGGMVPALRSGLVAERIESTWRQRMARLSTREETITGVSDFPNAEERLPASIPVQQNASSGLPRRRYSGDFEALRERSDAYERTSGVRPQILLVTLGAPADFTARLTYAKSFFAVAGIDTPVVALDGRSEKSDVDSAIGAAQIACLCSSDERYVEMGIAAAHALAVAGTKRIYLAAKRTDKLSALEDAGVDEFIGVGCDVLEVLRGALDVLGIP
jgi:methylmalonyl-CoA mutase